MSDAASVSGENRPRVVLASGSAGKLRELRPLLADTGFGLVSQAELGIDAGPETADTFVENALSKARHVADRTDGPVLADDSGLVVPALDGAPGVRSARFAGYTGDVEPERDAANNALLLERMAGVTDRRAWFCCVLVVLRSAADPLPLIAHGVWHGTLLTAPRGEGGFGYDPLFVDMQSGKTAAELAPEDKRARSHRGLAIAQLLPQLEALREQLDAHRAEPS